MQSFTINGFAKGMDDRRPSWAALASTLTNAKDVILTSAGDVEVRKNFSLFGTVPFSTYGLAAVGDDLKVFGIVGAPVLPTGVGYQQLTVSGGRTILNILSWDLFDGKIYVAVGLSDGSTAHYYDGVEVSDWYDGRARSSFDVTAGTTGGSNAVTRINVNGVDVLGATVLWATSHVATAAAIAAQINAYASVPEYSATSIGATVIIRAAAGSGSTPNGFDVDVVTTGDVVVSTEVPMANGRAGSPVPGDFVRTVDTKMYSPSDTLLNFSSIDGPLYWNTDRDGAGFVDLSRTSAGSEDLTTCEVFLDKLAVFARKAIQIWNVEADDTNNARVQTLLDVGTDSRNGVAQFRGTDVFFRDRQRGILAIVPSGANDQLARIEDVGLPIKKTLKDYEATLLTEQLQDAICFVEPGAARFWCVVGNYVFVYSWHQEDGVSGWTYFDVGFQIEHYAIAAGRLYVRSGNAIYLYGGANDDEYPPADVGEMTFAAFRASAPERVKGFAGVDFGLEGDWEATWYSGPRDTVGRVIARPYRETFDDGEIPISELSSNPVLKLKRKSTGYARVCQLIVHYAPASTG